MIDVNKRCNAMCADIRLCLERRKILTIHQCIITDDVPKYPPFFFLSYCYIVPASKALWNMEQLLLLVCSISKDAMYPRVINKAKSFSGKMN